MEFSYIILVKEVTLGGVFMNEFRPKLELSKTTLQKTANLIGYGLLIVSTVYSLINLSSLPSQVAIHFNSVGEADGWGSKYLLLLLPLIGIIIGLVLEALEKNPHVHNYPAHINESNVQRYYAISIRTSNLIKNATVAILGLLQIEIVQSAKQADFKIGAILMAVYIVAIIAPILWHIVSIIKMNPNKSMV